MFKRFVLGGAVLAAVLTAVSLAGGLGRSATASVQLDPEEQAFVVLLNDYRAQNGLGPLSIDSSIQSAAEWMSTDMGENDYFSHTDSLGGLPWDRMCDFGLRSRHPPRRCSGRDDGRVDLHAARDQPRRRRSKRGRD